MALEFFDRICRDEKINMESAAVLHSDNGDPMRSLALAAIMAELGISLSFSRPSVSNDNAFALLLFRDILSVREWVDQFITWYNSEHRHSGIKCVTPNQRHFDLADNIFETRQSTYEEAKRKHPKSWSRHIKSWQQPEIVKINHPRPITSIEG